jgi:hypothetical protein
LKTCTAWALLRLRFSDDPNLLAMIGPRANSERRDRAINAARSVILLVAYPMRGNNIC